MTQITARLPDELAVSLDAAAVQLKRSRADVVRLALGEISGGLRRPVRGTGPAAGIRRTPFSTGMKSGVSYSVRIKGSAAKELAGIPKPARARIVSAIDRLREQPLAGALLKGGLRGLRRLRVGDYRIVYEVLDGELVVLALLRNKHRPGRSRRRAEHPRA